MWSSKRFLTSKFIRNLRLSSKPPKNRLFKPFTFKTVVCITAGISLFKLWENKQMFTNNKYECQGTKVEYSNPNVKYLTHPIIPYLMSRLRDPKCTAEHFRVYSDRIMQLLIEEAISQEPFQITQELSLTGAYSLYQNSLDKK